VSGPQDTPTPETWPEFRDALAKSSAEFQEAMAWARASFVIGNSFMNYRKREIGEAARLIQALPVTQRDMVLRWCAWMVGQEPEDG
jgi:hypothetical protein